MFRPAIWLRLIPAVACFCACTGNVTFGQSADDQNPLRQLHFRALGPVGNRAAAIIGEPGNPLVMYVGAASGGIFKTEDGGNVWRPIFDQQDVAAVGALAMAPSRHSTIWAGTGEPWLIRPDYPMGDGVYKSTDAGKSWQHMGLDETGHIARVVIDPQNPESVFVCAVGQAYKPQHSRGIFHTRDGGRTWDQVLFVDENTGCSDLAMDAHNSQALFAGMWQLDIKTWNLNSGGKGSGVYASHDGGATWNKISGHGLPDADHALGKVAVAIAPSDSSRVYALVQDTTPGLYRSNDGGAIWRLVNQSHLPTERSPYYTRMGISPDDPGTIYFPSVSWSVSHDGGETLARDAVRAGGDNHDVWIDPTNASRILVANDGGASVSLNRAQSYQHFTLPIAQVYHVYADTKIPYNVFGNRQDGEAYMGPSNNLSGSRGFFGSPITAGDWRTYGGCESGFGVPDPVEPDVVWSGCYDGGLDRMDLRTGQSRSVNVWPDATYGWAPVDVKYRFHWTFPIAISPFDHKKVYVGSQVVHVTINGGQTWTPISGDLTLNDKTHQQNSGGISVDNLQTFDGAVLYAIAESPRQQGVIWTGSNDGQVNVTRDAGKTWTNVTKNISGLPAWGTVMNVEPSHFDAGTAYIAVDLEQVGDYTTYVYKTTDFGASWKMISGTASKGVNSSAKCVREDPVRKGMLYLGTNNALYASWDDGGSWMRLRNNLPPAPVYWIEVEPRFHDLLVGTYGRGIYVLDDVTPLRDWDARGTSAHLFPPRATYRLRISGVTRPSEGGHVIGENPPYGADLNFTLPKASPWTIAITDSANKPVRTLRGKGEVGLNRVWWDLRYEGVPAIRLLTPPQDASWMQMPNEGWRPLIVWGAGGGEERGGLDGPRVPPGKYTLHFTAGGESQTATIDVLHDPGSLGSEADERAQITFLLQLRDELREVGEMIGHVERTRKQVAELRRIFSVNAPEDGEPDAKSAATMKAAADFDAKALAVEALLEDMRLTGQTEDNFRHPMMIYGKLANLEAALNGSGADLPPTDQQVEVNKLLVAKIAEARQRVKALAETDTVAFNQALKANGFSAAIQP
jgi:photosystem II stability/assembly factor-like uncharacterized protein